MDENHQDKKESKLTESENATWVFNKKSKLWVLERKTGFEDKTLWDKLNLFGTLAIPLFIALATIGFGLLQLHLQDVQHQLDQQSANIQHERDQANALDQQRAAILQTYLDNIQDLLLNHNLLQSKSDGDVAILARARTLTALKGLDPERKSRLLIFLNEARLIGFYDSYSGAVYPSIIALSEADLRGAILSGEDLRGADLRGADLRGAHFFEAVLTKAHLDFANLSGANLSGADLDSAKLIDSNLSGADLSSAILSNVTLFGANFDRANLRGADLSGAQILGPEGNVARNLSQQQLDQVFSCMTMILPSGLTCHRYGD